MIEKMHFFLTGTDTGIGKTYFASWLVKRWRDQKYNAVGLKPISCGSRADAESLRAAGGDALDLDVINPLFLKIPGAPYIAAPAENRVINLPEINASVLKRLSGYSHAVVEGVGGWLTPIARGITVREWAWELGLPVVVVARAGLGTLNHTLLTVESIQKADLECLGIVLNAGAPEMAVTEDIVRQSNPSILAEITGLPIYQFEKGENPGKPLPHWLSGQ